MSSLEWLNDYRFEVNQRLKKHIPAPSPEFANLYESMRYSLLSGGKRIRSSLALATSEALTGSHEHVLDMACAIEMIHAYSLIHDDLPCMDDDDYRRGRLTNHRVYGESMAVLAGDGLLTLAFQVLSKIKIEWPITEGGLLECILTISRAVGPGGMVGGQALDIASEGNPVEYDTLRIIHANKTGQLIRASVAGSALLCSADCRQLRLLDVYADQIGLAYQIKDDILDIIGDEDKMGKAIGSDEEHHKATYPSLIGLDESKLHLRQAVEKAGEALLELNMDNSYLYDLLEFLISRDH